MFWECGVRRIVRRGFVWKLSCFSGFWNCFPGPYKANQIKILFSERKKLPVSLLPSEDILYDATEKAGWDEYSQLLIVLGFIEFKNLTAEFQEYVEARISEENAEYSGDDDEDQEAT